MDTTRDYFIKRWEAEQRAFRNVIAALPSDKLSYAPHERSTKAGDLAWQLVAEQHQLGDILAKQETSHVPSPHPGATDAIVKEWDKATDDVRKKLQSTEASKWNQPSKMLYDGKVVWEEPLGGMLWGYLFDMVHHRGQLSAYLRPMGGKVPAIYGPSADDSGQ